MSKKDLKNAPDIIKKFYKDHFNVSYQLRIIPSIYKFQTVRKTCHTTFCLVIDY